MRLFLILPLAFLASLVVAPFALAQIIDIGPVAPGQDVADAPADLEPYAQKVASDVATFQELFLGQYGRYAQTLSPYTTTPEDGVAALPDDLLKEPTSGVAAETLWTVASLEAFPAAVWVDVYDGPRGHGYVINFEASFNKLIYRRAINVGPETWRDQGWAEFKPDVP